MSRILLAGIATFVAGAIAPAVLVAGGVVTLESGRISGAAGKDPSAPADEEEWHHLTARARAWLADVAEAVGGVDPGGMRDWLWQPDFAAVRDPAALAAMPTDQRAAWEGLWAEVRRRAAPVSG